MFRRALVPVVAVFVLVASSADPAHASVQNARIAHGPVAAITFAAIDEHVRSIVATAAHGRTNDAATWSAVRLAVSQYLEELWRKGALMGTKPEQAFEVFCGLGSSMTQNDVNEGVLIVRYGVALTAPASFTTGVVRQKL